MDSKILINVKTIDNKVTEFQIETTATVQDLKQMISDTLSIPIDRQRLIYQGKLLENNTTIQDAKINDSYVVHLVGQQNNQLQTQHQNQTQPEIAFDLEILGSILRTLRQAAYSRQNMRRVYYQQRSQGFNIDREQSMESIKQNYDSIKQLVDCKVSPHELKEQHLKITQNQVQLVNPFHLNRRQFKIGQWIDLKDTIDQWLEAQVVHIENNKIFVHYNGWGRRWDEWIQTDSPRIAVFRTFTVGQNNQDLMSPTPVNDPDADLEKQPVEMSDFVFDVGHMMNQVTSMLIEFAKMENQRKLSEKWLQLMKQQQQITKQKDQHTLDSKQNEVDELEIKSSLLGSQLGPLFDRMGRMMIDMAPHFAMMGTKTQEIHNNPQGQYQFQVPVTLTPAELQSPQLQTPTLHSRLEIVSSRLAVLRMTELTSQTESDDDNYN